MGCVSRAAFRGTEILDLASDFGEPTCSYRTCGALKGGPDNREPRKLPTIFCPGHRTSAVGHARPHHILQIQKNPNPLTTRTFKSPQWAPLDATMRFQPLYISTRSGCRCFKVERLARCSLHTPNMPQKHPLHSWGPF